MSDDSGAQQFLRAAALAASLLSLLALVFVVTSYALFPPIRRQLSIRLLLWLELADGIFAVGTLIYGFLDPTNGDRWCVAQAWCLFFSSMSSTLWSALMAYSLHRTVAFANSAEGAEWLRGVSGTSATALPKAFYAIALVFPLVISFLPFATKDGYGSGARWCRKSDQPVSVIS